MDVKNKTLTSVLLALKRFGRSKWTRRIGLGLLLFSLLMGVLFWSLLFNPFESDYEGPLAELVPSSVSLYVGADDLRATWLGFATSADRERMAKSERWQRFFRSPLWRMSQEGVGLAGLQRVLSGFESRTGPLLTEKNILELLGQEVAVAARLEGQGEVGGLFLARVGFRGKLVIAGLQRAVALGQVPGETLAFSTPVSRIGQGKGAIFVGRIADVVMVATSKALVEEVLLAHRLKGEGSLARSGRFQAALRGEGQGVRIFADFERADKVLKLTQLLERSNLPFPLPLFTYFLTESVDIDALELISGRFYLVDGSYDRIYWEGSLTFRDSRLSLFHRSFYRQPPHIFRSFKMLPAQLLFGRVLRMNPQLAWQFAQESMSKEVRDWFAKLDQIARQAYGIDRPAVDMMILPLLGEEFGSLLTRVDYFDNGDLRAAKYPLPGLVLMIRSPDSAQLVARLNQLFAQPHRALSTGRVKQGVHAGFRYSKFDLKLGMASLQPCYGALGDFFVLASHPLALQQMKDVVDGFRKPAPIDKVGPEMRNLRMHFEFGQMSKVLYDLAPKFAEEIVSNRASRIRAELEARYGRPPSDQQVSRVCEVRTQTRADRMRKGLEQYQIFEQLDLEWTARGTSFRCQARLRIRF